MSTLLWVALAFGLVAAIILSVVLTNRRSKRLAAARAASDSLEPASDKIPGDPGLYVMRDTLNIVEMPNSNVRGMAVESGIDDVVAHLHQREGDRFLTVSHTEEWSDKTVRVSNSGDVYAVDSGGVIVHGTKHKGRRVDATGRLDGGITYAILDSKCTLGGTLKVKATNVTASGSFLAYTTDNKAFVDQVTPSGLVHRGVIKAPGMELFTSAVVSDSGLSALVATGESIMSYSRSSVDVDFERTAVSANLGTISTMKHNANLSVVAAQSHMRAGGTNVMIFAWDSSKNHLGDVPRILNGTQGQELQQVKDTHVYVKTTGVQSQSSCINVYGPIRELEDTYNQ